MPASPASVSPSSRLSRATIIFLSACCLLWFFGEAAALYAQHQSNFYRSIHASLIAARQIRHAATPSQPRSILIVGNSLLKHGIDFDSLNTKLEPRAQATRLAMEGSAYYDWRYGLATLFRTGMRPDIVIVCLNAGFLADKTPPDELSAHLLFDLTAIRQVARDLPLTPTATSNLFFGHWSALYGTGFELRGVLLGKLIPAPAMWDELLPPILPFAGDPGFVSTVAPRLRSLRGLCTAYGARFLFLIPPMRERGDNEILQAGSIASTEVLHPIPNGALTPNFYEADGYHLNAQGAAQFTAATARALSAVLPASL